METSTRFAMGIGFNPVPNQASSTAMGVNAASNQNILSAFALKSCQNTMNYSRYHPYGFVSPNYGQTTFPGRLPQQQEHQPQVTCYNGYGTSALANYAPFSSFPALPNTQQYIPVGMVPNMWQAYTYPSLSLLSGNPASQTALPLSKNSSTSGCGNEPATGVDKHREHPFAWRRRFSGTPVEGMTRTRDTYRVVYTEKQRLGLEKAFKANKFITAKQRTAVSEDLSLSERQIKIWFQNRRAKERRQTKNQQHSSDDESDVIAAKQADDSAQTQFPSSCRFSTIPPSVAETDDTTRVQCHYQQEDHEQCISSRETKTDCRYSVSPSNWNTSPNNGILTNGMMTSLNISPFSSSLDLDFVSRL